MRVFWHDRGSGGVSSDSAQEVDLKEAQSIWSDDIWPASCNFFGLIDDQERTIQFTFDIPDDVDEATYMGMKIVLMDFPELERKGSYCAHVTHEEVYWLIEKAFKVGADYRQFGQLVFTPW